MTVDPVGSIRALTASISLLALRLDSASQKITEDDRLAILLLANNILLPDSSRSLVFPGYV
jgi:hypothetical protein